MSTALLRKAIDKADARDSALKWSLLQRVNDCVKELQLKCTSERSNCLNNDEATNSFLWVLEGVFIHGLNNSFLKASPSSSSSFSSFLSSFSEVAASSLGAGSGRVRDVSPAVPNPSFWEFVLVFLHRDLIDQIQSLHLIHTDVGRCRAWLRIALNEGLLQSFLENMTLKSNRRCLKAFYRSSAFLRDTEKSDILKNYLMGIELLDFRLVINNSFLNNWNSGPLSLVGLWVDENESVQQGVDVAQNIESKEFQAIPKLQQRQQVHINAHTPPRFYSELDSVLRRQHQHPPLLSEDDALRIILSSSPRQAPPPPPPQPVKEVEKPSRKRSTSSQRSSTRNAESSTDDLPEIAEEVNVPVPVRTSKQVEATTSTSSVLQSQSQKSPTHSGSEGKSPVEEDPDPTPRNASPEPQPPGTLELSSPSRKVMTSSPAEVTHTPRQLSTSVSSIEMESPGGDNERSYADLLLKYQQRSKNQNQSQSQNDSTNANQSQSDESYTNLASTNHNSSAVSTSDLIAHHSIVGGSSSGGRSRKNSTTGSMNTTTTSGVSSKSSKFTRAKVSQLLSQQAVDGRVELLRLPHATSEQMMELLPRISKFTKILATEQGLDSQNYSCKMCSTSIGMIYGPGRLCHFTGALYCTSCHAGQERVIPSRILLNWDFALYPVCKQAHDFLEELKDEPVFDLQEINSVLYTEIDEMKQAKVLRTKLFYIGMYLKTCKNGKALEELRKEMGVSGKEHLIESIHLYTLSDLLSIPNRTLANLLTKLVGTGSGHILSCTICREKGFICEICRKPQVIFPFEMERIYKCGECGAVYHNTCMDPWKKCPRCERWKRNSQSQTEEDGMDCDDDA